MNERKLKGRKESLTEIKLNLNKSLVLFPLDLKKPPFNIW
jgi:hypothetical protein